MNVFSRVTAKNGGTNAKTALALALALCLLIFPLFSRISVFACAGHEHDQNDRDGGCSACAYIQIAGDLLKMFTAVFKRVAFAAAVFAAVSAAGVAAPSFRAFRTPVSLKIKING
ncbi:MAG: hypothetical protein LBI38_03540 [Oscillospiraceae bacterium]|nr:hypothetical protein [Oscillospiraceae bacterium]